MNILIIGEWSGYAKNLKEGFVALGHKVVIISNGDGFKKIPTYLEDIRYAVSHNISLWKHEIRGTNRVLSPYYNFLIAKKLKRINLKFDLVIIINENFIRQHFYNVAISLKQVSRLLKDRCYCLLSCCGNSISYRMFGHELRYYSNTSLGAKPFVLKKDDNKWFKKIIAFSDSIVSVEYDYTYCIKKYCKKYDINIPIRSIPLPITIETEYNPIKIEDKIVILHGVIREKDKGSDFIVPALKKINAKYSDKVEIIIDGHMPYNQYVKLLDKCHIMLDEANSYGFGVNAVLGLMKGKVVFAGNEKENQDLFSDMEMPIINIIPDVDYIYNELEKLIKNPHEIEIIGDKSRKCAEKYLSSLVIAQQYIDMCQSKSE